MYQEFYGLNQEPFRLTPDPEFFFLGDDHNKSLAHLLYGINNRKGFIALTGEVGAGKTTLCRLLLKQLDDKVSVAIILNSLVDELTFLKQINRDFSIPYETNSHDDLVSHLYDFLIEEKKKDKNVLIIVDECQNLKFEVLEQIRMLSNLETEKDKLLQILLIGQPEFLDMLNSHELRQLNQRITVRAHISAFKPHEMEKYIYHRLSIAGNVQSITFDKKALKMIFENSKGIPRRVNVLCDYALLAGYVAGTRKITALEVKKAIQDIEIKRDKQFSNETSNIAQNKKIKSSRFRIYLLSFVFILALFYFKDILFPNNSDYFKRFISNEFVSNIINLSQTVKSNHITDATSESKDINKTQLVNNSTDNISEHVEEKKEDDLKSVEIKKLDIVTPSNVNQDNNKQMILPPLIIQKSSAENISSNSDDVSKEEQLHSKDDNLQTVKAIVDTLKLEPDKIQEVEKEESKEEIMPDLKSEEVKEVKEVTKETDAMIKNNEVTVLKNPTSIQAEQYFKSLNNNDKGLWLLLSSWGIEINHPRLDSNGRISSLLDQLERFNFAEFSSWADLSLIVKINIPCAVEVLINNEKHYWVLSGVKDNFLRFHIAPGKDNVITVEEFKNIWQGNSFFILEKGEYTIDGQDVLFKGMENYKVEKLANILKMLGIYKADVKNIFDLPLEQSVIFFQQEMGLVPDGIISVEAKLLFYSMLSKNIPRLLSKG